MSKREDGYYWVAMPGSPELLISYWNGSLGWWTRYGYGPCDDIGVGVVSGPLRPPDCHTGCMHEPVFRRGVRCLACGTIDVTGSVSLK